MVTVHREVERKYAADDGFELPPLTELMAGADGRRDGIAPVAEGEPVRQRLAATYFDTADLRLAAAGLTLRRRTGGGDAGWHLKVPAGPDTRSEVRLPLGRGARTVPARLRQMVWAQSLGSGLRPVAEIVTDRTVRRLADVTGRVVAEVADDRVTARRLPPADGAAGAASSWREIEVELRGGGVDLLAAVDARLRERGLSEAPGASKLARVLGVAPGAGAGGDGNLTAGSPAGEALLVHLREQVAQVRAQDLPVRLDAADAVHKMRVATRRLRSALTTFKPLFDPAVARPLRGELKWLAGELGAARDAEVMRDRVRTAVEAEAETLEAGAVGAHPVAGAADAELGQAYRTAHDRVLAELDGDRYHALLTALDRLVTAPPLRRKAASRAGAALPPLVARSYAKVRTIVARADATPPGAEREELLHEARKAAKRARYAGESVSRVFGSDAVAFAAAMEDVQEALGEHQDSVLTRERLRELARHTASTDAAFLYGRLHARQEAAAEQSQRHFDAAWKTAGRKRLHRWLH
jgi:CHAD domain-containing protein